MLLFVVFSYILVSFAAALPAPNSELSAPGDNGLHTNALELYAGMEEPEILSPIPEPPELEPIGFLIVDDGKVEQIKDNVKESPKEEEEKEEENNSNLPGSKPETGNNGGEPNRPEQGADGNNQFSFIYGMFPWLSNISWPPSISSWNFPNFGIFNRQVVYAKPPQPNYRYVLV